MKALNLDIAGEFLVMAATLLYIKSRSLLPRHEDELEPEEDPEVMRAELSRRLVEYERIKEAAARLAETREIALIFFLPGADSARTG